jgi:hypothetical protein
MLHIQKLSFGKEPSLILDFDDGRVGRITAEDLLRADLPPYFRALSGTDFFYSAMLRNGVVCWPGELDLAPEYLYFLSFRDDPALAAQFAAWGYLDSKAV